MREMKNSGIEWIGKIPCAWKVERISSCFSEIKEKNTDNLYNNALQFKMGSIIRKPVKWDTSEVSETYSNYTIVHPNVIMINGLNLEFDFVTQRVAMVKEDGIITSAYIAIKPSDSISPPYMCYLLKTYDTCQAFHNMGKGLRKIMSFSELKTKCILIPYIDEQHRIVSFLDHKCANIDSIIEKTKTTIAEYRKLKQSITTEAVTKGIRGDRPMKDSGIEWIGEIPREWKVCNVKKLFKFGKCLPITKDHLIPTGIPVISYGQIHSKTNSGTRIQEDLLRYVSNDYLKTNSSSLVHQGDFIFADTSEDLEGCGNCAYINHEQVLFAGYHTIILQSIERHNNSYLAYLFLTDSWRSQIRSKVSGVKLFSISKRILASITAILPHVQEQFEIVEYLDKKCNEIDTIIAKKAQYLIEIESYKKSLIYECVTGKKEVVQ